MPHRRNLNFVHAFSGAQEFALVHLGPTKPTTFGAVTVHEHLYNHFSVMGATHQLVLQLMLRVTAASNGLFAMHSRSRPSDLRSCRKELDHLASFPPATVSGPWVADLALAPR